MGLKPRCRAGPARPATTAAALAVLLCFCWAPQPGASTGSAAPAGWLPSDLVQSFYRIASQPDVARFLSARSSTAPDGRRLIFDVGINNGHDARAFSEWGFTIVGVDANPDFIRQDREAMADLVEKGSLVLVHAGIEESVTAGTGLTFWKNNDLLVLSSFERRKSCEHEGNDGTITNYDCEAVDVPLLRCEALWIFGAPYYLKVDIEERHYACVRALKNLPRELLPQYVSWEMHEYAKGKRYPVIDTQLLLLLGELGYDAVKYVAQTAGAESAGLPEDSRNYLTGHKGWSSIEDALRAGLMNPRDIVMWRWDEGEGVNKTFSPWFDFHMRLSDAAARPH